MHISVHINIQRIHILYTLYTHINTLDTHTHIYTIEKRKDRAPAWCDRVVFKQSPSKSINVLKYHAFHGLYHSDHRPVLGLFDVTI